MEACSLLDNLRKRRQSSIEQPLVGEERYVTTRITAAKETNSGIALPHFGFICDLLLNRCTATWNPIFC